MKNTYKTRSISESVKSEWMMRERGSYEDHHTPEGEPPTDHVYAILERSPKGRVRAATKEEAEALESSASYGSDFDGSDEAIRYSKLIARFSSF